MALRNDSPVARSKQRKPCSAARSVQAGLRGRAVRQRMDTEIEVVSPKPGTAHGEVDVVYTLVSEECGIEMAPHGGTSDDECGVILSEVNSNIVPESIKPGMLLTAINGEPVGTE